MVLSSDMQPLVNEKDVVSALKSVIDPEMHIDIYTLGLIYRISIDERGITILMTLTTPLCPYAGEIVAAVEQACAALGLPARIELTFTPSWVPPQDLRAILGV